VRLREKTLGSLLERLDEADPASPAQSASLLAEADAVIASGPVDRVFNEENLRLTYGGRVAGIGGRTNGSEP